MNVVQHKFQQQEPITDLGSAANEDKHLYVSIPLGLLSASQLNALAFIAEKYSNNDYIDISPTLNVEFDKISINDSKDIFNYLVKHGLITTGTDVVVSQEGSCDGLDAKDKLILVDIPNGKLRIKQLRGMSTLMKARKISDIHLINECEFLFTYSCKRRISVLRQDLNKLGLQLRSIL